MIEPNAKQPAVPERNDLVIIGGGLAGLMAAWRAEVFGLSPVLINVGVPGTAESLGGFAQFSGAKFSLFPAGTGLAPIVGGHDELVRRYEAICANYLDLGFSEFQVSPEDLLGQETHDDDGLAYRNYHSILLTPARIDELLVALADRLTRSLIKRAVVTRIEMDESESFCIHLDDGQVLGADKVIVAAGRLGSNLLKSAGIKAMAGKGIDVGVRLGFETCAPVAGLRNLGPDAKFIADGVRTFCLNSPGRIFHYPGAGFCLPGGIVAEPDWHQSNIGILCRIDDRDATLRRVENMAPSSETSPLSFKGSSKRLEWTDHALALIGEDTASRIDVFIARLSESGLVALPPSYTVHYPLLDWHWPVFSQPGQLGTSVPGLLAAGDASGHARGLMQAALMGVLAVEEALS